jgi:hypothetical protein
MKALVLPKFISSTTYNITSRGTFRTIFSLFPGYSTNTVKVAFIQRKYEHSGIGLHAAMLYINARSRILGPNIIQHMNSNKPLNTRKWHLLRRE